MSQDDVQREHEATDRKLDEMREKGQTLRSKDLSSGMVICMTMIALALCSDMIKGRIVANFQESFNTIAFVSENTDIIISKFSHMIMMNFLMLIPLFILVLSVAFSSVFLLGGWNFSLQAVGFKWEKLNPITNLSNIFSRKMLIDVFKSFFKYCILMLILYLFASSHIKELIQIPYYQFNSAFSAMVHLIFQFIITLFMGVIVIVCIDMLTSYFTYHKSTMMSTQELVDERKNTEGNQDIKRKMRSLQFAMMKQRIPQVVPEATVVITNPTHYAVALQYVDGAQHAPKMLAKGKGPVAAYIRQLAIANGIPIYEEPPLARAIYHTTKINGYINPELYVAVAIVLTYINQLKLYQAGTGGLPTKAKELSIPKSFMFNE